MDDLPTSRELGDWIPGRGPRPTHSPCRRGLVPRGDSEPARRRSHVETPLHPTRRGRDRFVPAQEGNAEPRPPLAPDFYAESLLDKVTETAADAASAR